ncbi:protein phosphatase [Corynebacterium yudongzhengii]|uniref:Serine/threonine-protein phosphatase n=1 Tax=Corynebacterium yudongzhengii TaxID=2080740 RepID=A0A2U1T531_9CORY|nr:protein phosphatase 2C domain-containing protein [Corynebacterium yudongzhengii]AWB80958.1 protein phosphatase [Corynebacterium yudongzhengii]PWC01116.1 serine/threonine-protein phosphatase [Corynebacterium yudongzhengii]
MTFRLNFTIASDRGLVRGNNEDSAYAGPNLLVLADGMGGHAAGEVASALMVEQLEKLDRDPGDNDMLALLGNYAEDANRQIARTIRERPETDGMGTTLTAVMFNGREVGLIHVGDSRGYRLREGKLTQLTVDDTFVQSLVDEGKLDPADVSSHPRKSLILKAYTGMPVDPTLAMLDVQPGDRLLLCSDGLSDPVTASTIEAALGQGDPAQAAKRLVELALRSGGPDNVTVVVADVLDERELSDVDKRHLPTEPVVGGALAGDAETPTHPDTSAGRAAALRRPATIPPNQAPREPEAAEMATGTDEDDDEESDPSRAGRWFALAAACLLILGLIGVAWWGYARLDDQYFVAVDGDDNFVVEQGADFSLFGRDLHTPMQRVCINEDGNLRYVDANTNADCSLFGTKDLPEPVRGSVESWGSGSYEEIVDRLQRLSDEALPVCVSPGEDREDSAERPEVNCRTVEEE